MTVRTAVFLYITGIVLEGITAVPKYGPYDIIIHELKSCDEEGTGLIHFDTKIHYAGGGKHVYNSNVLIGVPVDEDMVIKLDMQQWSSQGYRPRAFTHTAKGCKAMWPIIKTFLVSFFKAAGVDLTGCPIPKGNYTATNWEVAFTFDALPVFLYNKYKSVLDYYYQGEKVGCLTMLVETVPKKQ